MENKMIKVRNLTKHLVGFVDEDTHRRFQFRGYEEKNIPLEILQRLNFSYGGQILLQDYLSVQDPEACEILEIHVEDIPEYNWTKKDIQDVLLKGSLDRLKDALDFAPEGIIDAIVDTAIELEINDVSKREAISMATGKEISDIIENKHKIEAPVLDEEAPKTASKRRCATKNSTQTTGRRVTIDN